MARYKERLVECYKKDFKFTIVEEYAIASSGGLEMVSSSICPAVVEGTNYSRYKCNGLNKYGLPCPYAKPYPAQDS